MENFSLVKYDAGETGLGGERPSALWSEPFSYKPMSYNVLLSAKSIRWGEVIGQESLSQCPGYNLLLQIRH